MSSHHYYTFGMEWDMPSFDTNGNSLASAGKDTEYTYNGKEFQDDLGIDLHYYGFRVYDPAIGRFTSVDPLAEKFVSQSSFHYAYNNPLRFIDPDGRSADDIIIRSKNMQGDYQEILRIKSKIVYQTIDLDMPGLTMHDPISNAPINTSFTINEIVPGVSFDDFITQGGSGLADAWSINLGGRLAYEGGFGAEFSIAGFINGPDGGKAFGYGQLDRRYGVAAGGGPSVSAYFSDVPISEFGSQSLEGFEYGGQGSFGAYGGSFFNGVAGNYRPLSQYSSPSLLKSVYGGFSLGLSKSIPDTPKINLSIYSGYAKKLFNF